MGIQMEYWEDLLLPDSILGVLGHSVREGRQYKRSIHEVVSNIGLCRRMVLHFGDWGSGDYAGSENVDHLESKKEYGLSAGLVTRAPLDGDDSDYGVERPCEYRLLRMARESRKSRLFNHTED